MVGFQQIDAFAVVVRQVHGLRPLSVGRPPPVHSYEAVRRKDSVPELVAFRVVVRALGCMPPEPSPGWRNKIDPG